jgi:hypothetical protein
MEFNYRTYSPRERLTDTRLRALSFEARGVLDVLSDYCWIEGFIWADFSCWRSCYGIAPQIGKRVFPSLQKLFTEGERNGVKVFFCGDVCSEKLRLNSKKTQTKPEEKSNISPTKVQHKSNISPALVEDKSDFSSLSPIIAPTNPDISKVKESNVREGNVVKDKGMSSSAAPSPDELEIFQYWQGVMGSPKSVLDEKRLQVIRKALKLGYPVDDLKLAVDGCRKSDFHMGTDPKNLNGTKYNGLELIFRDREKIDGFISRNTPSAPVSREPKKIFTNNGWVSESEAKAKYRFDPSVGNVRIS